MKLYHILPIYGQKDWMIYKDYLQELTDLKEFFQDIEYIIVNPEEKYQIDYVNDYVFVTDISKPQINFHDSFIKQFKKENRIAYIYESMEHMIYQWKIPYVKEQYNLIFTSYNPMVKEMKSCWWTPAVHLHVDDLKIESKKINFCAISPIQTLALKYVERSNRIKLIQEYCQKRPDIKVYGTPEWITIIPEINYAGLCGKQIEKITAIEKVNSKCQLLASYKFIIVFENLFLDGYITEKLSETLYSSSLVIYYGPPNIEEMYPNLFDNCLINGHKYSVDNIINMMNNMSKNEYNARITKMLSIRNKIDYYTSSKHVKNFICRKIRHIMFGEENIDKDPYSLDSVNKKLKDVQQISK